MIRIATLVLLASTAAGQSIWYVDDDAPGFGSGTVSDPYASVQYAIDRPTTLSGDEIRVRAGTYLELVDLGGKSLRLVAFDGPLSAVLDGQGLGSVVTLASGEGPGTSLEGFTLRNGAGVVHGPFLVGGGVYASGVTFALKDCLLEDHAACDQGGALWADASTVDLEGCVLRNNLEGGGLHAQGSLVTLIGCTIEGNRRLGFFDVGSGLHLVDCTTSAVECEIRANGNEPAGFDKGGGVFARGGSLSLVACTLSDNRNEFQGGALDLEAVTVSLTGCTIADNESVDLYAGGALYVSPTGGASDLFVSGCVFRGNYSGDGGAAWLGAGTAQLEGCTFEDNVAAAYPFYAETGQGGAAYVSGSCAASFEHCVFQGNVSYGDDDDAPGRGGAAIGAGTFERCTFVENRAESTTVAPGGGALWGGTLASGIAWQNEPDSLGGFAAASYSCVEGGYPGIGNTALDPHLWSIPERDLWLLPESIAIDAGDPAMPTDADGSRADMGALPYDRTHCGVGCNGPLGKVFCVAQPNSTGQVAVLFALGSKAIADDRLLLFVDNAPPGEPGLLLVSDVASPRPFDLTGKARVCLGIPKVLRSVVIDSAGRVDVDAAFGTWPPGTVVLPGVTWRFQLLFHDVDPVPLRNTSSGLRVTFH